ncbi:MAG: hypothetical protein V3R52_07485 [Candidatus Neomarinimicrobiota bacterium]
MSILKVEDIEKIDLGEVENFKFAMCVIRLMTVRIEKLINEIEDLKLERKDDAQRNSD